MKLRDPDTALLLVIGIGNVLRGDDAAGSKVAETLLALGWPGVRAVSCPQLVPELAAAIAEAERVVFVDANPDTAERRVQVRRVDPRLTESALNHTGDPAALLALTQQVFGRCPDAWMVAIPAAGFELGAALSPAARRGVAEALRVIRKTWLSPRRLRNKCQGLAK